MSDNIPITDMSFQELNKIRINLEEETTVSCRFTSDLDVKILYHSNHPNQIYFFIGNNHKFKKMDSKHNEMASHRKYTNLLDCLRQDYDWIYLEDYRSTYEKILYGQYYHVGHHNQLIYLSIFDNNKANPSVYSKKSMHRFLYDDWDILIHDILVIITDDDELDLEDFESSLLTHFNKKRSQLNFENDLVLLKSHFLDRDNNGFNISTFISKPLLSSISTVIDDDIPMFMFESLSEIVLF